ncbi:MAG TPA: hypothetical protein VJH68_02300 [Candidatus Nanoarchaeia archaeon]|nr:hypothetical protein [Candidatus Nanoarchaeia archaeon]
MGLYCKIELYQQQQQRISSPINGLSPLELELLLDQSLEQVKTFHDQNPEWRSENQPENRGNYFWQRDFLEGCKSVRGKISREKYLENPHVFVERSEEGYSVRYNLQLDERIAKKLAQFKRNNEQGKMPVDKIFSKRFAQDRAWVVEQQLAIVKYLCKTQERYLQTGNALDLEPINQNDVAEHIGYSITSVSRLVKNLSIQLPDSKVIFARELMPGKNATTQNGACALKQLQEDPALYGNGKWMVSARELVPILRERFGIKAARRTVSKYQGMLR